jgi:DNA-binding transcriptional LysR family regulator
MELRHLRYFAVVGEKQHYGRASRRLRVAQPALSRHIRDLEEEVGFKLFDRLPRGVKLSLAGKLFLEDARRILQAVSEATARAAHVARGQSGTLRVGFPENARQVESCSSWSDGRDLPAWFWWTNRGQTGHWVLTFPIKKNRGRR